MGLRMLCPVIPGGGTPGLGNGPDMVQIGNIFGQAELPLDPLDPIDIVSALLSNSIATPDGGVTTNVRLRIPTDANLGANVGETVLLMSVRGNGVSFFVQPGVTLNNFNTLSNGSTSYLIKRGANLWHQVLFIGPGFTTP